MLFQRVQDEADSIFCKLPPPKPSAKSRSTSSAPVRSMRTYHCRSNGCVHGDGKVTMADRSTVMLARDIKKGDRVATPQGDATVRCVVISRTANGRIELVTLPGSGLRITAYHPVHVGGEWVFPVTLREQQDDQVTSEPAHVSLVTPSLINGWQIDSFVSFPPYLLFVNSDMSSTV